MAGRWTKALGGAGVITRYPLGTGADPTQNHRTKANRLAVEYTLQLLWVGGADALSDQVATRRGDAKVGYALAGRFVTRAELTVAVDQLHQQRNDLFIPLYELCGRCLDRGEVATRLGIAEETLAKRLHVAFDFLIDRLWVDGR